MATEVWFRNPSNYVKECVEQDASLVAWARGYLVKKNIDPERFGNLYFPSSVDYRMLLIGDQGTAEVRRGHPQSAPVAVYPTWIYGADSIAALEDLLARPVGEDKKACADKRLPADQRPVLGQEHRVVVSDTPSAATGLGREFYRILRGMQAEYPDAILHVHGLYSYNVAFGNGYRSVDIEPRTLASKGKVTLPNGREMVYEKAAKTPQWVHVTGFAIPDLVVPRNRCMFNMRSAWWAAEHYMENLRFRVTGQGSSPIDTTDPHPVPSTTNGVQSRNLTPTVGDKFDCDTCSLRDTCKYFRAGSVCSLPDSDGSKLAKHFNTRNSSDVIDGLAALMEMQAKRAERGLRGEQEFEELDPHVTKILDGMFDKGVTLAKLIDPSLSRPTQVNVGVQVNGQTGIAQGGTNTELAARAVAALEARGYERADMTPALIEAVMSGQPVPERVRVIEATATDG